MAGRIDPPHDRVMLSVDEQCAIERLERELSGGRRSDDPVVVKRRRERGVRRRLVLLCMRWVRLAPWLLPVGLVVMVVAMPSSLLMSALGALLAGVGIAACIPRVLFAARRARGQARRWFPG